MEGKTLRVSAGSWSGPTPIKFAYQWQHNGTDIPGSTGTDYTLSSKDVGYQIDVVVTASNSVGSSSATSLLTAAVTPLVSSGGGDPPPPPPLTEELTPPTKTPPTEEPSAVSATPLGLPAPPSGWTVAYADSFTKTIGTEAGEDNTWGFDESDTGFQNSNEIEVFRSSQVSITPEGLALKCTRVAVAVAGRNYECGAIKGELCCSVTSTEPARYHTPVISLGKGQTLAFQCVCKFPPDTGEGDDVSWWMDGPPFMSTEFDFFEAIGGETWSSGSMYTTWFAPPHYELAKRGFAVDPSTAYNTYDVEIFPGATSGEYRFEEWVDGVLQDVEGGTESAETTPDTPGRLSLVLSYGLRETGFASGARSFDIRSVSVYEDQAHAGVGIEDGGLAPGTTVG